MGGGAQVKFSKSIPEILKYYTMILQRIRFIVENAGGFDPRTTASAVWVAIPMSHCPNSNRPDIDLRISFFECSLLLL